MTTKQRPLTQMKLSLLRNVALKILEDESIDLIERMFIEDILSELKEQQKILDTIVLD